MFHGIVDIGYELNGRRVVVLTRRNQFMFEGADVIGLMLAGRRPPPAHAYFEFFNSPTPTPVPPSPVPRSGGREYYAGLELVGSPTIDYIRVRIPGLPSVSGSSEDYSSNAVAYTLSTVDAPANGECGLPCSNAAGSQFFGAAIVSAGATKAEDMVFARVYFSPIAMPAGANVFCNWRYVGEA